MSTVHHPAVHDQVGLHAPDLPLAQRLEPRVVRQGSQLNSAMSASSAVTVHSTSPQRMTMGLLQL